MQPQLIASIIINLISLALVVASWRLINKARKQAIEKVYAEPVDGPSYYQRRKAPSYRQTQANAVAYEIEAL